MAFSITALPAITSDKTNLPSGTPNWGAGINLLVIGIAYGPPGTAVTVTGISLGSNTASQLSGAFADNHPQGACSDIWYIPNPTGTSGALTVTLSGAINNGTFVQVWAITSTVTTPTVGGNFAGGVAVTSGPVSVTVPLGGGAVGIFSCFDVSTNTLGITGMSADNTPTWLGQFVTTTGISGHATGGSGSSTTYTATASTAANMAFSVAALDPGGAALAALGILGLASSEW